MAQSRPLPPEEDENRDNYRRSLDNYFSSLFLEIVHDTHVWRTTNSITGDQKTKPSPTSASMQWPIMKPFFYFEELKPFDIWTIGLCLIAVAVLFFPASHQSNFRICTSLPIFYPWVLLQIPWQPDGVSCLDRDRTFSPLLASDLEKWC